MQIFLQLADFEQLLSHYDARLAKKLNDEYLKEEWDFGQENLGSKKMFKDPPVICAEERMEMVSTISHNLSLTFTPVLGTLILIILTLIYHLLT